MVLCALHTAVNGIEKLTPQKKCLMKIISCLGATCGALYSSLKGMLWPFASKTSKSSTLFRSFSVGRSLLTFTVPSNSSCSFWSTGVWLVGENGGVVASGASFEVEILGSVGGPECDDGGEGGCAVSGCGVDVAAGGGAVSVVLVAEGSMLNAIAERP